MSEQPSPPVRRRGRPPSGGREAVLVAALDVLSERGVARLTTREVAERAGVSEGSVFYHFGDRTGLLTAVIEQGVTADLGPLSTEGLGDRGVEEGIAAFITATETFLARGLVVMFAAQSDAELRAALGRTLASRNLGSHRGVDVLGDFLRARQEQGLIRDDADVRAVAAMLYAACFQRVSQRLMMPGADVMPTPGELVSAVMTLLKP